MRAFPIIPTVLMIIICIALITFIIIKTKKITHIIIVILLFIVNERFMVSSNNVTAVTSNMDVLFVIDTTMSMNAEDYNGQEKRIDGVKKDCTHIIQELVGSRFGIIIFDNKSKILIPFTKDNVTASETIEIIEPIEEWYAKGSSLNIPLEDIEKTLKRSQAQSQDRLRILFYISDGEITDDSTLKSFSNLKQYIKDGAVLGYGTSKGGIMHYTDQLSSSQNPEQKIVMDKTKYPYEKAISKIDEKNLKAIASDLKIDYYNMNQENNLDAKIKEIKRMMKKDSATMSIKSYDDTYFFITPIILLLLVLDFRKTRRECS